MVQSRRQDNPLRILHTESSLELGGQEFRVLHEVCGMVKRGHYVVLAVPPHSRLALSAKERGVSIEEVPMNRVRWIWLILVFLKIIVKHNIQVVNTHGSIDSWTASIAGRLSRKCPLIIRTRHKSTKISQTWRHRLLYQCLPHAVLTTGEAVRNIVMTQAGTPPSRVISIPTGVDLETFSPQAQKHRMNSGEISKHQDVVVGTVAFFRTYKGLTYFLDAAKLVVEQFPNVGFLIVGDGPDYASIVQKREALGLHDAVQFTGFCDDVAQALSGMDIFVLASIGAEGVPQSVSQAMAMERPVIATNVGSISEIVKHEETGLLVEPLDAKALAHEICRLITNPNFREVLGKSARKHVEESYDFVDMLTHTEAVYDEFLLAMN